MRADEPNLILGEFMTVEDFAASVGTTPRTIKTWRYKRGLPVVKRGNLVLISVEKARAWLNAGERGGLKQPRRRARGGIR